MGGIRIYGLKMARNNKDTTWIRDFILVEWMRKIIRRAGAPVEIPVEITYFDCTYLPDTGVLLRYQIDNEDIIRVLFTNNEIDSPDLESIVKKKRKELIEQIRIRYRGLK